MSLERTSAFVTITGEQGTAMLNIRRGELNALNEGLLAELDQTVTALIDSPDVHTIVITGTTDIFMAGADLPYFARCLLQGNIERILTFTRSCHRMLERIENSPTPVVAWVRGAAVGAGFELALACHRIVADPSAKFALPETGLGIYPGMGGMQRLSRRIGKGLTKWLVGTGAIVPASAAQEIGLVDAVVAPESTAARIASLESAPRPNALSPRHRALSDFFGTHSLAQLASGGAPTPSDPQCIRAMAQLRFKAPRAIELADQLIEQGGALPLAEAIEFEFQHLEPIFRTEDARNGILSFGKTQPTFVGR